MNVTFLFLIIPCIIKLHFILHGGVYVYYSKFGKHNLRNEFSIFCRVSDWT